jgi:hypothetical protein
MSWRPEGWQTLKAKDNPLHCFAPDACVGQSFEAGADAMLVALRKMGAHSIDTTISFSEIKQKGETLVFIPDEESE